MTDSITGKNLTPRPPHTGVFLPYDCCTQPHEHPAVSDDNQFDTEKTMIIRPGSAEKPEFHVRGGGSAPDREVLLRPVQAKPKPAPSASNTSLDFDISGGAEEAKSVAQPKPAPKAAAGTVQSQQPSSAQSSRTFAIAVIVIGLAIIAAALLLL